MAETRLRLIIEGRVQGVWFRGATRRQAISLGVKGWVRNNPDGAVEVLVEGPEEAVRKLASWCRRGPSAASVAHVQEFEEPWQGEFDTFDVVY